MPTEKSRQALSFRQERVIDSLDEVAKGLAAGTISRGRAIKLGGAALLSSVGLLSWFPRRAEAQGPCEGKPAISNTKCPGERSFCGACEGCQCARTVSGKKRCLDFSREECPETDECDSNRDCPGNKVCVKVGACCEGSRRNLCVRPCPTDCPPPSPPPSPPPPSPPPPSP